MFHVLHHDFLGDLMKHPIFKMPPRFTSDMLRQFAEDLANVKSDQMMMIPQDVEIDYLEPREITKHECPYCHAPIKNMTHDCEYCGGLF